MTQIDITTKDLPGGAPKSPYVAPSLKRLGTIRQLTKSRLPTGAKDGGPNNTRSG